MILSPGKPKKALWGIFSNFFSNSFQVEEEKKKKGKVKISSGGLYVVPDIFHIFITIKWQFNQRNEYCILIGVICTRISCIIHGGGDHRWVSRRYRLAAADASGGSRHRLHCHDGDSYVKTRRALRELNVLIKNKKNKNKNHNTCAAVRIESLQTWCVKFTEKKKNLLFCLTCFEIRSV